MLLVSSSLAWRACAAVAVALAVVACGGETGPTQPPPTLAFTVQPSNAVAGVAISPAVVVAIQDAVGNTVVGATNTVTVAIATDPGSGTLSGTTTVKAVRGEATMASKGRPVAVTGGAQLRRRDRGAVAHLRRHNPRRGLLLGLERLGRARRRDHDQSSEPNVRPWRAHLRRRERRGVSHLRRHYHGRGLLLG